MLILHSVLAAPSHGHTITCAIERTSEDILQVEHGWLYPALHRLEERGLIVSFWGTSENNRKANPPAGKKHLATERSRWNGIVNAIALVLGPATE